MEHTKLGLIGRNISYSFSKKYFENKFRQLMLQDFDYHIYDCEDLAQAQTLLNNSQILGLNVTIPYKEKILPYLDELSEEARETGAVNCILLKDGLKKGFNTDVYGFEKTLALHRKAHHQSAIILGDGGAAKAVQYVCRKLQIPFSTYSRRGDLRLQDLDAHSVASHEIIIQCTPVGTFPNVDDCLEFAFDALTCNHLVIDLIYNPSETKFLRKAAEKGAKTVNGLYMLEQQAEKAWEIWNFQKK
ncbi:shikimate dehydrogenase [Chryseobacterium sp. 6424]|uniref:shikimate dehydrogenase family protein n=1 Tax=Chryseobacterium sp. 6424 TaxID=2039166 RepID=UPI000EFCFE35|nr:shikimate dehydrogenase [Chryseobacterium sp. 6424]AYO58136.1 shikimate dehydrogenase [Chryseobacterium sp. 6424]